MRVILSFSASTTIGRPSPPTTLALQTLMSQENKGYATLKALDKPHQSQPDSSWGGHAVVAVAWDNDNERVLCKNSWGQANYPYFWMQYHWITDFEATDDFWVVRTIDHSNPPTRISGPVFDGHVEVTGFGWKMNRQTTSGNHDKASTAANSVIASVVRNYEMPETFWVSPQWQVLSKVFTRSNTGSLDLGSSEVPEGTSFGSPSTYVEITKGAVIPGAIAAVKRNEERTDTFCIRCDGSICCYTKPNTKTGWSMSGSLTGLEIDGTFRDSVKASIKGGIAVVSRIQGHQEIWYVTPEGAIEGLYFYEGDSAGWNKYELAPQGSADPSSFITAVTAGSERMFVLWISKDGKLSGKQWVNDGQSWRDTFAAKTFAPYSAAMRSRIAAVSRRNDTVEVFFITPKGVIEAAYWYEFQGSWTRWNMAKYSARVDSGLTAIMLNDKRMEVLWVGSNNSLVVASFMEGWNWRQNVVAGPGSVMGGSPLGTFWRSEKSYSVMFQDYTNKLIAADFQGPE